MRDAAFYGGTSVKLCPQSHDMSAFVQSRLGALIMNGKLPPQFFINVDTAFNPGPVSAIIRSRTFDSGMPRRDEFNYVSSCTWLSIIWLHTSAYMLSWLDTE